ncbi:ATPase, T2SS/T4P/T4SS family [Granulosicoccaceae sp. 1_MG-2023]|nr:ATPase, T2SS/T4P/T4SS family [Granulosicoccaceae sp. 1_MG-2023]
MLGERLIERGQISRDQLQIALTEQKRNGQKLGRVLVKYGFLDDGVLRQVLAGMHGSESVNLHKLKPCPQALACLPVAEARRLGAVPVSLTAAEWVLACTDTRSVRLRDRLRLRLPAGRRLRLLQATEADIAAAISAFYVSDNAVAGKQAGAAPEPQALLAEAVRQGASDVHLEPGDGYLRIRFRVDGVLHEQRSLHAEQCKPLVGQLKVLAGMDLAETRKPQDGRFTLTLAGMAVDFRAASFPTIHGESLVLRVLKPMRDVLSLEGIGLGKRDLTAIAALIDKPDGLILIAGPTGSGKTSTLYAILERLNDGSRSIVTLEDPVEFAVSGIRQSTPGRRGGMSFHEGLKSLMRQDPDVVVVGEIRDGETATIALRAAMTGHRVLATVHTRCAFSALQRLTDLGVPPGILQGNISGVVAQRLIRRNCRCGARADCPDCHGSGFHGRQLVAEILRLTAAVEQAYWQGDLALAKQQARLGLWRPLQESAQDLLKAGTVAAQEVQRVLGSSGGEADDGLSAHNLVS